jgi:hypothetical protein
MRVFRLAAEFFGDVVHPLIDFLTETLLHARTPLVMLRQLTGSEKFMESLKVDDARDVEPPGK